MQKSKRDEDPSGVNPLVGLVLEDGDPEAIFEIQRKEGSGAFGAVFRASYRKNLSTVIAVKVIRVALHTGQSGEEIDNVRKEIEFLRDCHHNNIIAFHGAYYKDGALWLAMEYCGGGSVGDLCQKRQLTEIEIAVVLRETLQGIAYLHEKKKMHRDLKGGNILLTTKGDVKLADFGVSAQLKNTMARCGTFVGTPYWMSPEMMQDSEYNYKADIWSLGITAIELADQKPPLFDMHIMKVLQQIPRNPPPTLKSPEKWSTEFNNFISFCLVKDPKLRPSAVECLQHSFFEKVKHLRGILADGTLCKRDDTQMRSLYETNKADERAPDTQKNQCNSENEQQEDTAYEEDYEEYEEKSVSMSSYTNESGKSSIRSSNVNTIRSSPVKNSTLPITCASGNETKNEKTVAAPVVQNAVAPPAVVPCPTVLASDGTFADDPTISTSKTSAGNIEAKIIQDTTCCKQPSKQMASLENCDRIVKALQTQLEGFFDDLLTEIKKKEISSHTSRNTDAKVEARSANLLFRSANLASFAFNALSFSSYQKRVFTVLVEECALSEVEKDFCLKNKDLIIAKNYKAKEPLSISEKLEKLHLDNKISPWIQAATNINEFTSFFKKYVYITLGLQEIEETFRHLLPKSYDREAFRSINCWIKAPKFPVQ